MRAYNRQQFRRSSVVSTIVTPYCTASRTTYCDDFSPFRMRQLAWSQDPAVQTISLQFCDGSTGCMWGDVSSLSWLCSYTSRWMVQHLATCPMTACLRCWPPSASLIWCLHLCGPAHSHRLRWPGLPSRWTQTPEQSAGFHCVSPTRQSASSKTAEDSFDCGALVTVAFTAPCTNISTTTATTTAS